MTTTTMLIKTNKALKEEATRLARELGVPLTTIVNAHLAQFVRDRQVTLSLDQSPTKKKILEWEAISAEMDTNVKTQKVFTNSDDLLRSLKISV